MSNVKCEENVYYDLFMYVGDEVKHIMVCIWPDGHRDFMIM